MSVIKKNINEWTSELKIKFFSTSQRSLENNDIHIRKLNAKEFLRLLRTTKYSYDNRNLFNKKLIAFSKKYNIRREHISKLLELRRDDYVKYKEGSKIFIGRFQGELNNGRDLMEIEINENGALNFFYISKDKILFPTRKEISRVLKKEIEAKSGRTITPGSENYFNQANYNSYYD